MEELILIGDSHPFYEYSMCDVDGCGAGALFIHRRYRKVVERGPEHKLVVVPALEECLCYLHTIQAVVAAESKAAQEKALCARS